MVETDGLEEHLQVLVDFWDNMLFQSGAYKRNAMMPHLILNKTIPFLAENFKNWLSHFNDSVDELFEGELAHAAKTRALSIATVMEMRVNGYQNLLNVILVRNYSLSLEMLVIYTYFAEQLNIFH